MTSKRDGTASSCFVYMTLPGEVDAVVAGRVETVIKRGERIYRFVYGRSYLERQNAVQIDPVELERLDPEPYQRLEDLFGAVRDAGPDAWGRRLIDRVLGAIPTEIGYLMEAPDDGAGALAFGAGPIPPPPKKLYNQTIALADLQNIADAILADEPVELGGDAEQVERLLRAGTSMGGARPKIVVEDDGALWVAKFGRQDDKYDVCRLEKATLDLAGACGIEVAQAKIVTVAGRAVLMVRRFDRERGEAGWLRQRMISGLTVLKSRENDNERWSYLLLADELRRTSKNHLRDPRELFSRMVFNAIVNNDDDHPRNHALIADAGGWRLSPAYDLVPRPMLSGERRLAMTIGDAGRRATRGNVLSRCERFLVKREEADAEINRIKSIVDAKWYPFCRTAGLTDADCERVRASYLSEGFEWNEESAVSALR